MPPKVPASKQKAPWLSRFNVGVCFAVGVSILILANYTRVAQQPVLAPGLQDSSAQGTPLRNTLDAATVQHINAASVGVTSASNSLTETHIETLEPVDANAEGSAPSKKKKKKALWEIVEDEVNAEDLPKEPSSGDHDKPQDEHMKEIFQDKELMQVEQEIFTKVKAYDDNQHFYDCGDLTTDWRVADVVNRYEDYLPQNLSQKVPTQRYFIASVLHNDVKRIPSFTREMIKLIRLLHHSPVFVSLYEASSTDGTKAAIQPLVQVLETLNVAHRVVHGNEIRNSEQSKANFVATLRNRVMEPLYDEDTTWMYFDKVIFLDGSFFCGFDVIEMLKHKNASITCGLDVVLAAHGSQDLVLRDPHGIKDIDGKPFSASYPYASVPQSVDAVVRHRPFRVYSCFDGLAVFDASPMHTHGIRFREPGLKDCQAGQGALLSADLWDRGFKNHILIPTVRTAKDPDSWQLLASRKSHLIETLKESQKNDNGTVVVHGAVFGKPDRVACCVLEANGEKHSDKCS